MQNFSSIGKRIHARKKIGPFFDTPCMMKQKIKSSMTLVLVINFLYI